MIVDISNLIGGDLYVDASTRIGGGVQIGVHLEEVVVLNVVVALGVHMEEHMEGYLEELEVASQMEVALDVVVALGELLVVGLVEVQSIYCICHFGVWGLELEVDV